MVRFKKGNNYMVVYSKAKIVYKDINIEVFLNQNKLIFCDCNQKRNVKLPINALLKPFLGIKLIRRLFRIDIRCFERIDNNYYFFFKNKLYTIIDDQQSLKLKCLQQFDMSSPLYFTKCDDKKTILFGDYTNDDKSKKVNIYRISDSKITICFSFGSGIIKHIHNIVPSYNNGRYWILTGDSDAESAIWELDHNNNLSLFLGPSQIYRSCFLCESDDKLYYLTDSPIVDNFICIIDKKTKQTVNTIPIAGPCIFATLRGKNIYFSTSVEPNPDKKQIFNNYRKSNSIKDRFVHIYRFNLEKEELEELSLIKKDFHNMKYFGFGNAQLFVDNNDIFITPIGVKKYSYKTLKIHYE